MFELACSVGSIVDFTVSFRLSNIVGGTQNTVASAVNSGIYYLALDGPSSNKYVPVGLPTTF
jgi:hypothetical protein